MCNANKLTQCRVARSYTHSAHSHTFCSSTVCRGGLVVSRAQPKLSFSSPKLKNCFSAEQPKSVQIEPSMWTGSDCCGSLFSLLHSKRDRECAEFCVVCVFNFPHSLFIQLREKNASAVIRSHSPSVISRARLLKLTRCNIKKAGESWESRWSSAVRCVWCNYGTTKTRGEEKNSINRKEKCV